MPAERGDGVIRVLIAGREAPTRAGLSRALEADGGIAVVGETASDEHTVALARETRPDVVLIDSSDGLGVLATTRQLLGEPDLAGIQVLMIGRFERERDVLAAWRNGVGGLVDDETPPDDLVRAVRMAASGAAFLMRSTTRRRGAPGPADT